MKKLIVISFFILLGLNGRAQIFELQKFPKGKQISAMYEDQKGNLWFYNDIKWYTKIKNQVIQYDGEKWYDYSKIDGKRPSYLAGIVEDENNNIFFGSPNGLFKYYNHNWENISKNKSFTSKGIYLIKKDRNGKIWLGLLGGFFRVNLGYLKNDEFEKVDTKNVGNPVVQSAIEDNSKNIYFYASPGGVVKYDGNSYSKLQNIGKYIEDLELDNYGNLWIGGIEGKFTNYNNGKPVEYKIPGSYFNGTVGAAWMILGIIPGIIMGYVAPDRESISIIQKNGNTLWFVARNHGIAIFENNKFKLITTDDGITKPKCSFNINLDKSGNIWVAKGKKGVSKFDGKKWTNYSKKDGLPKKCFNVFEDSKGNIWVTGKKGIARMKKD